jgi:Major Facilitator Superfamily
VVTLALPPIIAELDASVEQAAAVLGVYTLALAVALPLAARVRGAAAAGALVFAAASLGCGLADSIEALLVLRGVQAAGAAALLVGAFALLDAGGAGRRAWTATAIFGFAAGPALGGVLTQALDWRAIFLVQAPIAAAAAVAAWRAAPPAGLSPPAARVSWPFGPAIALALLSAALVGVLFLLVLLLITGWSTSPLAAAAAVTVLPVAAVAASRIRGPARTRAAAGAVLVAGGILALASLPGANLWWTVPPQLMAGAGLGLALPALAGGLLPEETPEQAAWLLSLRHAGITAALILLAPVAAAQLDDAVADTRIKGTALVLDARLPPLEKLSLAGTLIADIDPVDPRGQLDASLERARPGVDDKAEFDALARRADETLVAGVQDAFATALAICGVLGGLAAVALLPWDRRVLAAVAAAAVLAGGMRLALPGLEPEPVQIADPCQPRDLPSTGGIEGALQDAALVALDRAACRFGSSREELALALVDDHAREDFEREYGVDPRSVGGLLGGVLGL